MTRITWAKRLLGAALAVPMTMAGMALGVTTAVAADTVPTDHLVAQYDFTTKPADGKTVANSAPNAALGAATVQNASDGLWSGESLTLSGGAKDGSGDWVKLPENILAKATSATVTMEVKADATMLGNFHFMWNIGNNSSDTEYFFTSLNCGSGRNPLVGIKANGAEQLVQSESCAVTADRWMSVTARISNGQARLYIDGRRVASGNVSATPASIADQSLNTIGRSPWPDTLFKGSVANFRVYDSALTEEQIARISNADAAIHADELTGSVLNGLDVPSSVDAEYIALPTAGGTVEWSSSDPSVIAANGVVNQPSKGQPAKSVTLVATTTVRGQTATRKFTVTVNPTDKSDADRLADAAAGYVIPSVVRSGDALPKAAEGTHADVTAVDGDIAVSDGVITTDADKAAEGAITVKFSKNGVDGTVVKKFTVSVLPESQSQVIAAYDRNATSENEANNGDIAHSMHLALRGNNGAYTPYNENYGIFFARCATAQPENMNTVDCARSIKNPSLFYLKNGEFGVVSVRTNRGTDVAESTGSILVATSKDLLSYDEAENSGSIIDLGETNGVNDPRITWDSASGDYVISWKDDNAVAKYTTAATLDGKNTKLGNTIIGTAANGNAMDASTVKGIDDFRSGATIPVSKTVADKLQVRFGRIANTKVTTATKEITVKKNATETEIKTALAGIDKAELSYSDGSTGTLPIKNWDLSKVDTSEAGTYEATGSIKQTEYQIPFAEDRADPSVQKWEWTHLVDGKEVTETKFLMIATNDINGDCTWQAGSPHMPFRMADSIEALADTPGDANGLISNSGSTKGYNPKEHTLLKAGDTDADGNAIMHSFWAPEIHTINGRLTILFMAGYGNSWTNGHAVYMQLKQDANGYDLDPTDAANWEKPVTILRADGKALATDAQGNVGMSLDMTYFVAGGKSYYAWQQLGATYIATVDPANPARLTSTPVRIVAPEYAWNVTIAEGPNVVVRNGKAYLIFSGSSVGKTYTTGLAVADENADLTDPDNWNVLNYPIQKSGPFNGKMQLGTGHGMWSEDEDGNMLYVFHAYADATDGFTNVGGRDTFVRRVHWASDGYPIFDMSQDEELMASAHQKVTVKVVVEDEKQPTDPSGPSTPSDPSTPVNPEPGASGGNGAGGNATGNGSAGGNTAGGDTVAGSAGGNADVPETGIKGDGIAATGVAVAGVLVAAVAALIAGIALLAHRRHRA